MPPSLPSRVRFNSRALFVFAAAWLVVSPASTASPAGSVLPEPAMRLAVEEDWSHQEQRWGRTAESPEALTAALARAEKLLQHRLASTALSSRAAEQFSLLKSQCSTNLDATGRLALYLRVRWLARELALSDPDITGQPLLFMSRHRYICQMLHEYMGYYL